MPEISRFFGIVITMYYGDHVPPHFHARYGRQRALVAIDSLAVLEGKLSPRARALVTEWAAMYEQELRDNWERAERWEPLHPIPPLQ